MIDNTRVIVIGSGPAGATAALKLLERRIPVTMLESGLTVQRGLVIRGLGRNLYRKWAIAEATYDYIASGDPQTEWCSALIPGGLSNYWTGAVPRFGPEDFSEGDRLHEQYRWPVSYADLRPYYTYAEQLLGVVGESRTVPQLPSAEALVQRRSLPKRWREIAASAERHGQGLVYAPLADGPRWMVRRSGAAFNSFGRIVSRLSRFPDFELRLGAHVQRLTWNGALGRVDGVDYLDRTTGECHRLDADAVVLAAGPLASPKLLLQSTSADFPTGLGNTHGLLGHFLHDHPKDWCVLTLDRSLPRLDQPLHLSRGPYGESPPLMGAALTIGPLSRWDRILSFAGATTDRFGLVTFATMQPEDHNYLSLREDRCDQFGTPLLDIHIRYGPEVDKAVSAAHTSLRAILELVGIRGRLECPLERLVPGAAAHYGGAARMHRSPQYGVLDSWNRLHEVSNVAVVDASSFTTGVEKNPTLTVMALAARAADRVASDLNTDGLQQQTQDTNALSAIR